MSTEWRPYWKNWWRAAPSHKHGCWPRDRRSGLLFFLFGRRKQHIIKDKPITGRSGVQFQFGLGVPYPMLVILRVVPPVKGKEPLSLDPMQVPRLPIDLVLPQYHDGGLDPF